MNEKQLQYFKEMLETQLEKLLAHSGVTVSEMVSQDSHEIEYLDQASVYTNQVMKLRIRSRESYLIKKILNALERIENKTFGICETCEEEIAFRRLVARPVATKCIQCKTEEERLERLAC